jgi:hypothetical protein
LRKLPSGVVEKGGEWMKLTSYRETVMREESERPHLRFIRKQVPNGWIVTVAAAIEGMVHPIGVTFVPDSDYKWSGLELEEVSGPVQ